ncbi:hypothetical protein BG015_011646 [Linnemannia schmuckeri]|uniref:Uncharacterized protein n=1 Tax=Linnemannia schmuckeri TaxID=64567 RepID=A0A9P5V8D0_9FUNG|nr:hypothetical protein BG015_011646 [Linnemannia schmuckeri]
MLKNDGKQEPASAAMLQSTWSALMCSAAKSETFEDMYNYECNNSSTSTGFDDHDVELEDDGEEEEEQQGMREVDCRFHLRQHRLRVQHYYSDDDEEEEEEEEEKEDEVEEVVESRETANTLDHARHHRALEHSHGGDPAEEKGVQATTTTTVTTPTTTTPILVSSSSTTDNCIDANDMSSSSPSHSVCSSASDSPNPDAEDTHSDDGIHQDGDDFSTPPPPPQPQSQQQQHIQHNSAIEISSTQHAATTTAPSTTATPPELSPKSPSRPHLSIPRSIRFRASTSTDRLSLGAGSPLGRLQVHTVNRLEIENSFLLNQNHSLTRDIQHCRQTVQALKQILAQREDTIGRMKQEVHQAHLKIKFMDSLLSGQRSSHPGQQPQQQQQQRSYQPQPQQQHGLRYQRQQQQEQQKGLEGDWKERHRQNDDYDDDGDDEVEVEEGERGVEGSKEEVRSSSLLDMYAAQDEPPFNWLLKGWDEGEMAAAEGSDCDSAADDEEEDEDEGEEDRDIPRQVRSIFSGVNDDEQYNSDEYTDDDDEEYDDDEDERGREHGRVDKPRSLDFQGSGIYHHHSQQRPLSGCSNNSRESSASSLSMSLGNNSTCILSQECNNDHEDDDDDDEDTCDTNDMNIVNGDGCVFVSGERQSSPVSLPSPALSESSMSLESQSERSNGSVTSLSCSSLISTSTSTSDASADEKEGPPQQRQHESIKASSSSTDLSSGYGTDHQGLQLPAVVPYNSSHDSGHFPAQVFTMDYEEQHLIVMDDTDMQDLETQSGTPPFSPTTTVSLLVYKNDPDPMISSSSSSSSLPANKKGLSIEIGNGLTSSATALIQVKDTSHHTPLCQPNGSHPCLGTSPPMSLPLALISRVHIETNASSTTLVSASTPSPTTTTTMAAGGSIIAHGKSIEESPSAKEVIVTAGIGTSGPVDRVVAADGIVKKGDLGGDDVVQLDDSGSSSTPSTPTTPTTTMWGPSSLFKGLLPSKRKNKSRSAKSKDMNAREVDGRLSPEGGEVLITRKEDDVVVVVVKEQSVAWTMLKNQSSCTIEPPATVEREASPPAPIVSEPAAAAASNSICPL